MDVLLLEPGQISTLDSKGACWAVLAPRSLLSPASVPIDAAASNRVVTYSGSYAELEGGDLFEAHPRTWGPPGWDRLAEACDRVMSAHTGEIILRPHARHVVSDVPGIRHFASRIASNEPGRFGLLLDPVAMLEPSHLARHDAADAIARVLDEVQTLGLPVAAIVAAAPSQVGDSVMHAALTNQRGDTTADRYAAAARAANAPIVVIDRADAALAAWTRPSAIDPHA